MYLYSGRLDWHSLQIMYFIIYTYVSSYILSDKILDYSFTFVNFWGIFSAEMSKDSGSKFHHFDIWRDGLVPNLNETFADVGVIQKV
jgi:hypothetical protein